MQRYYEGAFNDFEEELTEEDWIIGKHCATKYDGKWHRAQICDVAEDKSWVRVFYLDYGTCEDKYPIPNESQDRLCRLRAKYRHQELPYQALYAKLYRRTAPDDDHDDYSKEEQDLFQEILAHPDNASLLATKMDSDGKALVLDITVRRLTGNEDEEEYINVDRALAWFKMTGIKV